MGSVTLTGTCMSEPLVAGHVPVELTLAVEVFRLTDHAAGWKLKRALADAVLEQQELESWWALPIEERNRQEAARNRRLFEESMVGHRRQAPP